MVELFTAGRLSRSPGESFPVPSVARWQLPTPAALNELTRRQARTPRTGFAPALFAVIFAAKKRRNHFTDTASLRKRVAQEVFPHRPSSRLSIQPADQHLNAVASPTLWHWIERRDYFDHRTLLPYEGSIGSSEITPTSLHRSGQTRLHVPSAKGQHNVFRRGKLARLPALIRS